MDIQFDGRRALITGAGKGIGNAIAKALAAGGAETVALSRTQEDLDKLKAEEENFTFFWKEKEPENLRVNGVGFAATNSLLHTVESPPTVGTERILSIRLATAAGKVRLSPPKLHRSKPAGRTRINVARIADHQGREQFIASLEQSLQDFPDQDTTASSADCGNVRGMYDGIKKAAGHNVRKLSPFKSTSGEMLTGRD
ncbi:hypothetical protein LSAT2_016323 [Lamellibrachia satsuma]|nr:hypothetical protein LSAT2_016323 [Lamellibrachia satsuma]